MLVDLGDIGMAPAVGHFISEDPQFVLLFDFLTAKVVSVYRSVLNRADHKFRSLGQ